MASKQTPLRAWLVELVNEAGKQLQADQPDPTAIEVIYDRRPDASPRDLELVALSAYAKDTALPSGPPIKSLPRLSDAAGGVFGFWAIAGEPGLGKSTLARQIGAHLSQHMPVLDYDYENGPGVLAARLSRALGSQFTPVASRWYVRESIQTLEDDVARLGARALIIIDSVQALPLSVDHATDSLARWVRRFERLARQGHAVLAVSEKGRAYYGEAHLAGYKGTGALEYAAWFGVQLVGDPEDGGAPIEVHVVKNRHRAARGHVCSLVRDEERVFWFREEEAV